MRNHRLFKMTKRYLTNAVTILGLLVLGIQAFGQIGPPPPGGPPPSLPDKGWIPVLRSGTTGISLSDFDLIGLDYTLD